MGGTEKEPRALAESKGIAPMSSLEPARQRLLQLAAASKRGQAGGMDLRERMSQVIASLEASNPTAAPARASLLEGRWELVYASEDPTHCSPFFWALRRRLKGMRDPNPLSRLLFGGDDLVENTLAFTDAVPIKSVGMATQRLRSGELVNQVNVGVFPTGESEMTTTCSYKPDVSDTNLLSITVVKTQVLGASLAASILDQISFPSGEWLGESATFGMRVTYLDESLRIVRDAERETACFVFSRAG